MEQGKSVMRYITPQEPLDMASHLIEALPYTLHNVKVIPSLKVTVRADYEDEIVKNNRVALVGGGGSGHEPAHAGLVGKGMLTAAVAGNIFASPGVDAILTAIKTVTGPAGCLVIVKNYTGDRLNFGLAVERARFLYKLKVDIILVDDDAAISRRNAVGKRGIAGVVWIHKLAGAASELGMSLEDIKSIAAGAAADLATMGVSFSNVMLPGVGGPLHDDKIVEDGTLMIEFGKGIHGEPGASTEPAANYATHIEDEKLSPSDFVANLNPEKLTARILQAIFDDTEDYGYLKHRNSGQEVAILINSLGGTTFIELNLIAKEAVRLLEASYALRVKRMLTGTFVSSLNMLGFSISILLLSDMRIKLLDHPAQTSISVQPVIVDTSSSSILSIPKIIEEAEAVKSAALSGDFADKVRKVLNSIASSLISKERDITLLDSVCGDGDCGVGVRRAAENLVASMNAQELPLTEASVGEAVSFIPPLFFSKVGHIINRSAEGSLGVILNIFLEKVASSLEKRLLQEGLISSLKETDFEKILAKSLYEATENLMIVTGAKPSMKTLIDALFPGVSAFLKAINSSSSTQQALVAAAQAACEGAESTKWMLAKAGRASYASTDKGKGFQDPGAYVVAEIFSVVSKSY